MARNDPFWMTARYSGGNCPRCQHAHRRGERIFYYPLCHSAYCEICGKDAAADFAACLFDERMMSQ